jgi:glycosyltransferase involved in cell wall biosynthesis
LRAVAIDIVLPFWGRLDYLQAAVSSVLAQTVDEWHLTVVDDAYPDPEPARWVESLTDPRVTYVRNPENLGVSKNFARALELATADYVVILGTDDVLLPDYVKVVTNLATRFPDAAMLHPNVSVMDHEGRPIVPLADRVKSALRPGADDGKGFSGERLARSLARGNWAYFPAITWRTSALKSVGFAPQHEVVQDLRAILDLVLAGESMVLTDEVGFTYRRHGSSVSSVMRVDGERFVEERALLSEMADRMKALGWNRAARAARCRTTSRLNALSAVPSAVSGRDGSGLGSLLRHVVGP